MFTFHLFNYAEMLALITSIFCISRLKNTPFILFVPFLAMIVIGETIGKYLAYSKLYTLNIQFFNVLTVIEFCFYAYIFYCGVHKPLFKKIVILFIPFYVLCAVINQVWIQGFQIFHSYTMILGSFFMILFVFFYFYESFESREPITLLREPLFWISTGIFLFYLGDFAYNIMYPYLIENNLSYERRLFRLINNNLIVVLYVCFSIGLILCNRKHSIWRQL